MLLEWIEYNGCFKQFLFYSCKKSWKTLLLIFSQLEQNHKLALNKWETCGKFTLFRNIQLDFLRGILFMLWIEVLCTGAILIKKNQERTSIYFLTSWKIRQLSESFKYFGDYDVKWKPWCQMEAMIVFYLTKFLRLK